VSDFHPLSEREIELLLKRAQQTGDWRVRNSIQIRLCQGIRKIQCPRDISNAAQRKNNAVSILYLEHGYRKPTRSLIKQLHAAMNS
jgi:hypothetical protein